MSATAAAADSDRALGGAGAAAGAGGADRRGVQELGQGRERADRQERVQGPAAESGNVHTGGDENNIETIYRKLSKTGYT